MLKEILGNAAKSHDDGQTNLLMKYQYANQMQTGNAIAFGGNLMLWGQLLQLLHPTVQNKLSFSR